MLPKTLSQRASIKESWRRQHSDVKTLATNPDVVSWIHDPHMVEYVSTILQVVL